jgi:hypothetical protein
MEYLPLLAVPGGASKAADQRFPCLKIQRNMRLSDDMQELAQLARILTFLVQGKAPEDAPHYGRAKD